MNHKPVRGKVGRNDPCPCGSGLKYKWCCMVRRPADADRIREYYLNQYSIRLKEPADIEGIRQAGRLVVDTLDHLAGQIRPGVTTDQLDTLAHEFTIHHGGIPAPLNYKGFPRSICTSVNEVICHGIPGNRFLREGDIINIDVTTILHGYYADANKTYFVGRPSPDARKIVDVTRECLRRGMAAVRSGGTTGDIGWAIQQHAESHGCSVVREFVGHGVGFAFHEEPQIPHFGRRGHGIPLVPGMVFTIEPMINLGERHLKILSDQWTAITADGSLSAQFEQTILVTEDGCESLTPFDLS
ncbi:MAG: type I methionyl aminopeptidase [Acidobacteria bacterium]|nr:type I methionyl aminopeptidase [Acidobacteriota bacterium]